jgi:polysaccharide pyruvyl transferase CsaB
MSERGSKEERVMPKINNILIDGYYGFRNLGDEAILRAILKDMAETVPGAHISVLSHEPEISRQLHSVSAVDRHNFVNVTNAIESSDMVVIGGGGLFHEHYRLRLRDLMIYNYFATTGILARAFGKPLYYYGIGLGPFFTTEGFSIARFVLSLADFISVRDRYSLRLARALGATEVSMTADPAFLLEPTHPTEPSGEKIVFVSLREWVDQPLEDRLVMDVSGAIAHILSSGHADKVVFLPFQTWDKEEHDDRRVFNRLTQKLPDHLRGKTVLSTVSDPQEMVDLLSTGYLMIGERLHSIILAAAAGLPFVALAYDKKVEYVCRDLGMSDFCLNIREEFGEELLYKVRDISSNLLQIRKRLKGGWEVLSKRASLNKRYFQEFAQFKASADRLAPQEAPDLEREVMADLKRKIERQWDRIEGLTEGLRQKEDELTGLTQQLQERNEHVASVEADVGYLRAVLGQRESALELIHNSGGWKALSAYYRARDKIFPEKSVRRRLVQGVLRFFLRIIRRLKASTPNPAHQMGNDQVTDTGLMRWNDGLEGVLSADDKELLQHIYDGRSGVRAIAFYLPQFHPIPENDAWWGKGFTEWTNVAKAKPLFEGHYQPHVPGELGVYDLRSPETRLAQAKLAKEHGLYGFCYYHYWFNGKLLLNQPLDGVLASGEPEFPFCLCWANEDWTRAWDGRSGATLIRQDYSDEDDLRHIATLAAIFADRRYIRIEGKPLFLVYRANRMPRPSRTVDIWREEARRLGIGELYLCRVESFPDEHTDPHAIGFDAAVEFQPDWTQLGPGLSLGIDHSVYSYEAIVGRMLSKKPPAYKRFSCVTPSWDNSPRRQRDSVIFKDSTPQLYEKWLRSAVQKADSPNVEENLVFINAWNEWGEGNHLEPDKRNGRAYLEATKRVVSERTPAEVPYGTLTFKQPEHPLVSIIVPVHNQWKYTYTCLASVLKNSGDVCYEVILADDCSIDQTVDASRWVENITIVRNQTALGFLKNCNNASTRAVGTYLVFLNNDTIVQKDWLKPLVDLMDGDGTIGLAGSKLIFPDGRLQEAGGIVWKDGTARNYGRSDDPDKPEYNYVKEVDYISGAAVMVRRTLWEEIGGFDETFSPAYYEDTDLAFEARKRGYKVVLQPKSAVIHFEGMSHGTDLGSGIKSYQGANQKRFVSKWKRTLMEMQCEANQDVFHARDRSQSRKTMLVIDNSVPDYDKLAGSRTMFQYLKLFIQMGFNVKFIDNNYVQYGVKYQPYTSVLEQLGIEVLSGPWYRDNWKTWIKEHGRAFDYVYLHKAHPSIEYIDIVQKATKARIIYNCADFHYLRRLRQYKITKDPNDLKEAREYRRIEFYLFDKSDIVFTYSEHEEFILSKKMPHKKVYVTPIFFYDEEFPLGVNNEFESRKDLTFVGGFSHTPNIDAVQWFVNEVFPRVLEKSSDIKLNIIGSNPPDEILRLRSEHINVTGFVPDEKLEEYYSTSRIVIAPIRFGAGVKGKIIEAIAHGIPLVTTSVGVEGIHDLDGAACIANREDEFVGHILDTYYDKEKWSDVQRRQIKYANKHLTMKYAKDLLAGVLQT